MIRSLMCAVFLAGCAKTPVASLVESPAEVGMQIVKSPLDHRKYSSVVLDNGLEVLLISDPQADMAAAALNVHVGQFADPSDRQGLAHFLEHMLFMGTERYPDVDGYRKFITTHAGRSNAGTGQEHTAYHFHIAHDQLEPALDRFSQFFVAPLLNPEFVRRERNAVNSEYQLKIKDDVRRIREVRRKTSNPAHPFSKFSVGNLETLADREGAPVYQDLKTFYVQHYSASRMSLAVLGRESVEDLESMVQSRFSAVASDGVARVWTGEPLFLPEQLGVRVDITPLSDTRTVQLQFPMPNAREHWRTRPIGYLNSLLGHEGEGSLTALLKAKGWVERFSAQEHGTEDTPLIHLEMELTEDGFEHLNEAVGLCFQFARLLRASDLPSLYHDERKQLAELRFRFQSQASPVSAVQSAASALHRYPAEHVMDASSSWDAHDPQLIGTYADLLTPQNVRMYVIGPDGATDKVEPLYDTPYAMRALDPEWMKRWSEQPIDPLLRLPAPNAFVASKVDLKAGDAGASRPVKHDVAPGVELWHQLDQEFGVPRAYVSADVFAPAASVDLEHRLAQSLLVRLIDDSLEEWRYPARLAGLSVRVGGRTSGLTLTASGYDDKLPALMDEAAERIAAFEPSPERFEVLRSRFVRQLRNESTDRPIRQGLWGSRDVLDVQAYSADVGANILEKLTFDQVKAHASTWTDGASLRVLAHGNLTLAEATALTEGLAGRLVGDNPAPRARLGARRIPAGAQLVLDMSVDHADSFIVIAHQGETTSVEEHARYRLLAHVLSTPFFAELRTRQQLGYTVWAFARSTDRLPGIRFAIQSSTVGPKTLDLRIQAFLKSYHGELANFDDAEFDDVRQGLIDKLLEAETGLFSRSDRYVKELRGGFGGFDKREQLVAALKQIDKQQLLDFYHDRLLAEDVGRLVVRSAGSAHADEREEKPACVDVSCVVEQLPDVVWRDL